MKDYYWTLESWGADYPPKNADEIINAANELLDAYAENHSENDFEVFRYSLWERYCSTGNLDTVIFGGEPIRFSAAVALMNDDLREEIHADLAPCSDQEFFDEYCKRHLEKFGDPFCVN